MLSDIERLLSDVASHITRWLRVPFTGTYLCSTRPGYFGPYDLLSRRPRPTIRYSTNGPQQKMGQVTPISSPMRCVMCYLSMNVCGTTRTTGSTKRYANWLLCSLFDVWQSDGQSTHRTQNWADYAESLASYVQELLSRKERQLPAGMTLSAWLLSEEESLRRDCELRDKNAIVAYSLLPIFEGDPAGWNAIRKLPNSSGMFKDYLRDWHSLVELTEKSFVNRIIRLFEQ